ncbi:MAG TPA: hypothetical protein VFX59_27930 [Polyangiales bacterium]|nr:hypothetical protein [Polyangiales bacterium]
MTSKEFCKGRAYSAQHLLYWSSALRRKERESPATTNKVGLVRVVRREREVAVPSCAITVRVGGALVEVPVGVDASTLTTVLAALGAARSAL